MREPGGWRFSHTRTLARLIPGLLIVAGRRLRPTSPRASSPAVPFFTAAPARRRPALLAARHGAHRRRRRPRRLAASASYGRPRRRADAITEIVTVVTVAVLAVLHQPARPPQRRAARLRPRDRRGGPARRTARTRRADRRASRSRRGTRRRRRTRSSAATCTPCRTRPHGVRLDRGGRTRQGAGGGGGRRRRHRGLPGGRRAGGDAGGGRPAAGAGAGPRGAPGATGSRPIEGFTTAVLAEIPHGDGVVRLVNRGHPAPLLLYADGSAAHAATPPSPRCRSAWASWAPGPTGRQEAGFPRGATLLLLHGRAVRGAGRARRLLRPGRAARGPGPSAARASCSTRSWTTCAGTRAAGRRTTWRCSRSAGRRSRLTPRTALTIVRSARQRPRYRGRSRRPLRITTDIPSITV